MPEITNIRRRAGLELNALLFGRAIPENLFQGARIGAKPTLIYDLNGKLLFYRVPIIRGNFAFGYADIAGSEAFGEPLLAVSYGAPWNEAALLKQARSVASEQYPKVSYTQARFVAYSYPKLAVQFLQGKREVLMLALYTWQRVPPALKAGEKPAYADQRWSMLDEMPAAQKAENLKKLDDHMREWDRLIPQTAPSDFVVEILDRPKFEKLPGIDLHFVTETQEIHYDTNLNTHAPCYELYGQLTDVWCVGASVQMILHFYRYNYDQVRIAHDLGLGDLDHPNGLPYGDEGDVVTVMEALTRNALDVTLDWTPTFTEFHDQICANQPVISFVPHHSRTVAGFTSTRMWGWYLYRGLLVYDPWPPTTGVITRWENFATQTYRAAFTSHLTLV